MGLQEERGTDGKVKTFKAWLVAKCHTQLKGVEYKETFSPVAMLKYIRIMLAIATYHDCDSWQMDVNTAFINGELSEDIYMSQPRDLNSIGRNIWCTSWIDLFMALNKL